MQVHIEQVLLRFGQRICVIHSSRKSVKEKRKTGEQQNVVFPKDQVGVQYYFSYTHLPLRIKTHSKSLLYADDRSVLNTGNRLHNLQIKPVMVLNYMSKWFLLNRLLLNMDKTKIMKVDLNYV